ncbi:MAG: restriction endonuclease subunit S [Candidatus Aminicenantes bacterium]|jgi:type I restriction enzyme S subunit
MCEWKEYKLSDLGLLQRGRSRYRPRYAFHLYGGDYPFIQTGEIREARKYITSHEKTYSEAGLEQSKLWPKGTLCITIAANIAELAILSFDACFPDSVLGFIPNDEIADLDFIYYILTHFQRELKHVGEGSVQDNINLGTFQDIQFPIPPIPEQKAIASVLSSLDDKIDLLHRQNKTLEAMAETLFRQWFVEEAQEDWEERPLSFFGEIICGKTPSKKIYSYFNGEIPFIKIPDMHGNIFIFETTDSLTEEGKQSQSNKTLPPMSICVSCIATVGLVSINAKESQTNQQINSIIPKEEYYRYFLYLIMKSYYDLLNSMASGGTATPNLNTGDFSKIPIPYPGDKFIVDFQVQVENFFDKIFINQTQIRTLEKLRDTLLPKLISGEVLVKI